MKKDTLTIIKERVAQAKDIRSAVLEYNIIDLPKDKEITPTSFYGVPAKFVPQVNEGDIHMTYTM